MTTKHCCLQIVATFLDVGQEGDVHIYSPTYEALIDSEIP